MISDRRVGRGRRSMFALGSAWLVTVALAACASPESGEGTPGAEAVADLVILGGRVMDPETRLDAVRDVAVTDGRITAVAEGGVAGRDTIDASGLVVAPGFVDLHAHGQDTVSAKLQALDGVTTALEMEIGVYPMAEWVASREGSAPIHFGATVSHRGRAREADHGRGRGPLDDDAARGSQRLRVRGRLQGARRRPDPRTSTGSSPRGWRRADSGSGSASPTRRARHGRRSTAPSNSRPRKGPRPTSTSAARTPAVRWERSRR